VALDTFGDLKSYVARARRDTAYEHWTADQTADDLNQGIQIFCDEVPLATVFATFEQAPDATTAGEYVPPLGLDLDEIIHLQTGRRALIPRTPAELFATDTDWATREGTPLYVVPNYRRDPQERQVLLVVPRPASVLTDLMGEFTRVHPWLTVDTERLLIPVAYRPAVAYYALHLGYAADKQEQQDLAKASYWLGRYEDTKRRAKKKASRHFDRSPSTVTLQR